MQVKIFQIPSGDSGELQEAMNRFLRGHKILGVQQELVSNKEGIFWCFCVRYLEGGYTSSSQSKGRIDYREVLSEEAFEVFSVLRTCRKEIADELQEKVYMVFTNEELAKMTELEELTLENIAKIRGIGEKKQKKYGVPLLEKYKGKKENEAGR